MRLLLPLLVCALVLAAPARGQVFYEDAFPNLTFSNPVDFEYAPDGSDRRYVVEKAGRIIVFNDVEGVSSTDVFLDIDAQVTSAGEAGLLGLAFHPDYAANGYFYVSYTPPSPLRSRISRFTRSAANPNEADLSSELVLLEFEQPFGNHNGGDVAFGPDGYLYASFGDGGSGGDPEENGQDETNLFGAILRLDVDGGGTAPDCGGPDANYTVPANAIADGPGGACDEIFAYGLRNPWRFSFDRLTGQGWVADVGQNAWEEISLLENGGNFGWDVKEGLVCFETPGPGEPPCNDPSLIDPVWVYPHSIGQSITGGFVYRGDSVPELLGRYVYADFTSGRLFAFEYNEFGASENVQLNEGGATFSGVVSFGEDPDGELYMTNLFDGKVYRFFSESDTSGEGGPAGSELSFRLAGPNPFRGQTRVTFELATPGEARIAVYDVLGREVAVLWDGAATEEVVTFDADGLPAGIYILRLETERGSATRKVLHLR